MIGLTATNTPLCAEMAAKLTIRIISGTLVLGVTSTAALTFTSLQKRETTSTAKETQTVATRTERSATSPPSINKRDRCLFLAT